MEDVVKAYEHLINTLQVDPSKIIVTGDSAGASLILEMLFLTHDPSMFEIVTDDPEEDEAGGPLINELPRPAGAVLISPLVTDQTTSESWRQNVKYDYVSQYTAKASRLGKKTEAIDLGWETNAFYHFRSSSGIISAN